MENDEAMSEDEPEENNDAFDSHSIGDKRSSCVWGHFKFGEDNSKATVI